MNEYTQAQQKQALIIVFKTCIFFLLILSSFIFIKKAEASPLITNACSITALGVVNCESGLVFTQWQLFLGNEPPGQTQNCSNQVTTSGPYAQDLDSYACTANGGNGLYTLVWFNGSTAQGHAQFTRYAVNQWEPLTITPSTACIGSVTQICDIDPDNSEVVTGPNVDFNLEAFVAPEDLEGYAGLKITLHNIDQNVLLFGVLSPSDILFLEDEATTTGRFLYSTTTVIGDGNYRIEACVYRTYFGGWVKNPFGDVNECQSNQFTVGAGTFIGNLTQNGWEQMNDFYSGISATSSTSTAKTCNPIIGWDTMLCLGFLLKPGGEPLARTMDSLRSGILVKAPWGYLTRTINIMNSTTTTALPAFTVNFQTSASSTESLSYDIGDMVSGGGTLLASIQDPIYGKNAKDVFAPLIKMLVAFAVLITIITDLTGSHKHAPEPHQNNNNQKIT